MIESNLYPDFFARFYDVIYHTVRSGSDHDYFMTRIMNAKGPVLEVGAGTGRFFAAALESGADMYGVDISPAMIEVLKSKLPVKEHHRIRVADICYYEDQQKYALIVAPFRVFMHFLTIESQLMALQSMHDLLEPGGTLIFDLFVPNLKMLQESLIDHLDFEGEYEAGKSLKRYSSMQADPINQVSHVKFRLEWEEEGVVKSHTWSTQLRFFFRFELELLLRQSVFEQYSIFGDFEGNPLTAGSKEFVVHCIR